MKYLILLCVFLSSCSAVIDTYCELYIPVSIDMENDTIQTMREVLINNKIYELRCNETINRLN